MPDQTKRDLIRLGAIFALPVSSSATLLSSPGRKDSEHISRFWLYRMKSTWDREMIITPPEYLLKYGLDNALSPQILRKKIRADFNEHRILKVNGLIVSKAEVALLLSVDLLQNKK